MLPSSSLGELALINIFSIHLLTDVLSYTVAGHGYGLWVGQSPGIINYCFNIPLCQVS